MKGIGRGCVAVALAAACARAPAPPKFAVVISHARGYREVRSLGVAPPVGATLLHTVGATDGSAAEFGGVRSVLLRRDGSLYVVDDRSQAVSLFDSNGVFVRKIGRDGGGPGEYRWPYSLAPIGGGFALLDPGNSRISLYDAADRPTGSWPAPRLTGGPAVRLYRTAPDFWALGFRPRVKGLEDIFIHYRGMGATDTLASVPSPPNVDLQATCPSAHAISFFSAPFAPTQLVVPTPDGQRAVAVTNRYAVAFLDAKGDTTQVIEREAPAAPVTNAEWDSATADFSAFRTKHPDAACDRTSFSRPAAHPIISWIFYDDEGRLWVETSSPVGPRYDIFDRTGALVATVEGLPASGGVDPAIAGNRIALAGTDSAGVPVIRVYRLEAK